MKLTLGQGQTFNYNETPKSLMDWGTYRTGTGHKSNCFKKLDPKTI